MFPRTLVYSFVKGTQQRAPSWSTVIMSCHYLGHTLKTQKQHISAAIYLLGISSESGTILDVLYLILIKESMNKEFFLIW